MVGFPLAPAFLRYRLKKLPFNPPALDPDLREDLAEQVWSATLQPASSFMNSVRERLEAAARTDKGGARSGGTYRPGAVFKPRVLIAILNIYRVYYDFFEMRPYESPLKAEPETAETEKKRPRGLRYPGTDIVLPTMPKARRSPVKRTPAMRHGMDAYLVQEKAVKAKMATVAADDPLIEDVDQAPLGSPSKSKPAAKTVKIIRPPDICRVLYRPWLYLGTPVGAKLDRGA